MEAKLQALGAAHPAGGVVSAAPLTLALPKGRLLEPALALLGRLGIAGLDADSRRLLLADPARELRFIFLKPADIPTYVQYGAADLGIVGKDILAEQGPDVYEPVDLGFGFCRLVVAEPRELWERDDPSRWSWVRVATKYPRADRGVLLGARASRWRWSGSTAPSSWRRWSGWPSGSWISSSPARRCAPTGSSRWREIMTSTARLIVNRAALKTAHARVNGLIDAMRREVAARPRRRRRDGRRRDPPARHARPPASTASCARWNGRPPRSTRASSAGRRDPGRGARARATPRSSTSPSASTASASSRPASRSPKPRSTRRRARSRPTTMAALRVRGGPDRGVPSRGAAALLAHDGRRRLAARPGRPAARPRRHLRAGRPRRLSLHGADDRRARARGRGPGDRPRLAARPRRLAQRPPCWRRRGWPASPRRTGSAARRRWPRSPTAPPPSAASTRSWARATSYVALAKARVFGEVGIDMLAGPSEVLVIADETARTRRSWPRTCSPRRSTIRWRAPCCSRHPSAWPIAWSRRPSASSRDLPRREIAAAALAAQRRRGPRGRARRGRGARQPPRARAPGAAGGGSGGAAAARAARRRGVPGAATPEVVGDYVAGPDHVLPTAGTARFSSALGTEDFVKRLSVIRVLGRGAGGSVAAPGRAREGGGAGTATRGRPVRMKRL